MPVSFRLLAATVITGATLAIPLAGAATAAARAPAARPEGALGAPRPGKAGRVITLANHVELSGYDAATGPSGTTYVGWIASHGTAADRAVYLCTLPRGRTSCAGGVQRTGSLGLSSANGLHVLLAAGKVTLIWSHTTTASESSQNGDEITVATRQPDGSLSSPKDVATAPSFGTLLDAAVGRRGSIWVVSLPSSPARLQVRPGLTSAAVNLRTPYTVGNAQVAFTDATAVLAIQQAGAITRPVSYADHKSHWSGFRRLTPTWTAAANLGLTHTGSGIRLLASVANADYWPVVSRWTGSSFSRPRLTGDRNDCAPASHDPVADASGRMADVSEECTQVAVANLTDTRHAAVVRFGSGGTFAGGIPQITTTPRGRGWIAWSIESSSADKLVAAPVLLPGRLRKVSKSAHGDRVTLTGPASCLPPVGVRLRVTGSPARHWHVAARGLRLNGKKQSAALNGARLAAGKTYTLSGRVVFADGGTHRTVTAVLRFRSCPNA